MGLYGVLFIFVRLSIGLLRYFPLKNRENPSKRYKPAMTLPQTITQTLDASTHPILLTGATASGKSQLGLDLARRYNGAIINADALQVYRDWRILSARPDAEALAECPHYLYGHLGLRAPYSVGHWLDELREALGQLDGRRAIILGGTGLYFNALTKGLSTIPAIPDTVRAKADELAEKREGVGVFARVLRDSDPATYARIDVQNPARTRRGWEVLTATGRGLSAWHADGTEAILPTGGYVGLQMCIAPDVLNARIDARFETMVAAGAVRRMCGGFGGRLGCCLAVLPNHRRARAGGVYPWGMCVGRGRGGGQNPHPSVCQTPEDVVAQSNGGVFGGGGIGYLNRPPRAVGSNHQNDHPSQKALA